MDSLPHNSEAHAEKRTDGSPSFTIAIPTYRHNPAELIKALAVCVGAKQVTLNVYDDGSNDAGLTAEITEALKHWDGRAKLTTAITNAGRSHARNCLIEQSDTDWILFLDSDMLPDSSDFIIQYLEAAKHRLEPALISGGFSLKQVTPNRNQSLHAAQSRASECISAELRARSPGRYVFTSNILVHKDILETITFDDGFAGWGWEDTDWGLRVAKRFPVIHINNTATHLGLDDTSVLLEKYGNSGPNFARMLRRNPAEAEDMALTKAARKLSKIPGRSVVRAVSKWTAKSALPISVRLSALKLYRAAAYAEHIK